MIEKIVVGKKELLKLQKLFELCKKHDGYAPRIYWNIVKDRLYPGEHDFVYRINKQIVGYLCYFVFKKGIAEISGFVHPSFRKKRIFSKLLKRCMSELKENGAESIKKVIFLVNSKSNIAKRKIAVENGAVFDHTEHLMKFVGLDNNGVIINNNKFKLIENVKLEPAIRSDIENLIDIHVKAFDNCERNVVFRRFMDGFTKSNRKIYKMLFGNILIGKTHIRFDADMPFLHDICIDPEYQSRGFATWMVCDIVKMLKNSGYNKIYLEVLGDNDQAIKVYKRSGFSVVESFEYWEKII